MSNTKVFVLMAGMTALFVGIGGSFGGQGGMVTALLFAGAMNFFMYFASSKMVLRMYKARTVTAAEAPELYAMVDRLRQRAALPMPTVAIAPHEQPNAFATGRNPENSVVCVTEGIMKLVSQDELEGVIAHELAHIKNRDMLLQTVAATMAGAIGNIAHFGFLLGSRDDEDANPMAGIGMMILAPVAAMLIQFAISRQREFKADQVGAEISGRPLSLANALRKLDAGAKRIPMHVAPAAAPLAVVNPLQAFGGGGMMKMFSTHPPTEERVARLERLAMPGGASAAVA
ncbi:MAG TPA: zinc metalloprotease HtpX [Gemmatimonadaceae bacterium]|nr:zinc metalloprotease HtpX [Gemmatimonadaceae bacterium]